MWAVDMVLKGSLSYKFGDKIFGSKLVLDYGK